ncbi:helix-turn-helix transcriptional regulator [Parabacteroides sp. PF5-9]|uniref:helix-turn-helix transcriptional regulator n=1 Tax=Parabacteroides sp. PF5-9 TaxID=1742404 RepID=UPI0024764DF3|nr:helix-turn-helix transcriptional regulator [Parabacteroides sp. PF5-9]MDH6359191.1 AraC-like DNA-binding protein [Parabacteroides sp. PF5-9]
MKHDSIVKKSFSTEPWNDDFIIYRDIKHLPLAKTPVYLRNCLAGTCLSGSAEFTVFNNKHQLVKNELIVIFPHQLAAIENKSRDFKMTFFVIPTSIFYDTLSGIPHLSPQFFLYMRQHYYFTLTEKEIKRFEHFCEFLEYKTESKETLFRRESTIHTLQVFLIDVYSFFRKDPTATKYTGNNHKEHMTYKFFCLIGENYREYRDVAYYADKLCITSKYLTMVVKEVTGRSAKEWLTEYVMLELKALLRSTSLSIKEIVHEMNFINQSVFGRFFKQHTGMSPIQYRNNIFN